MQHSYTWLEYYLLGLTHEMYKIKNNRYRSLNSTKIVEGLLLLIS